jgi:hypothetical protein
MVVFSAAGRVSATWTCCVAGWSIRRFGDGCCGASSSESSSARKPGRARGFGGFGASEGRGRLGLGAGDELGGKVIGDDGANMVTPVEENGGREIG